LTGFLRRILVAIVTGYIFYYFSEVAFWAKFDPARITPLEILSTWSAYSFSAFVFLAVRQAFRAWTLPAVYLCGALYGWLVEGVIVQTMYDNFPWQIVWTGLAWHALITIMLGWVLLRRLLSGGDRKSLIVTCTLTGFCYGIWAVWWWVEEGTANPPLEFLLYTMISTFLLVLAYWLENRLQVDRFSPSRFEWGLLTMILLAYIVFVTIPAAPMALWVLPVCLSITLFLLWRNRRFMDGEESHHRTIQPGSLPVLLLIPVVSAVLYTLLYFSTLKLPTGWVVYLVTWVFGFGAYIYAAWNILNRDRKRLKVTDHPGDAQP
jgi:hypothetical protein